MADKFNRQINGILGKMKTGDFKNKGDMGEMAVFTICEKLYQKHGGILYHSYAYKVDKNLPGNIKRDSEGLRLERLGEFTEIDVLYISPFRVIPIEVKSYKAQKITLTDKGIDGCFKTEKSPVHQNEMHARHLLSGIFEALPDGDEEYIKPIVVFVDECKVSDKRSKWQKEYIRPAVLDNLVDVINLVNTPYNGKIINLRLMEDRLNQIEVSCSKKLAPRYV